MSSPRCCARTEDAKARAAELLAWFDLTEAASKVARTYSVGMRRRLDLAASLVGRPTVIFLDADRFTPVVTDLKRPQDRNLHPSIVAYGPERLERSPLCRASLILDPQPGRRTR